MALLVVSSTVSANTASATNLSIPYPASIAAGNRLVMFVVTKPYNAVIATPAGWNLLATRTNGTTAAGTDIGSVQISAYDHVCTGSETGSLVVLITSGDSCWGSMFRVTTSTDIQSAATTGLDTVANTSMSIAFDTNPGLLAGDVVLMALGWSTDAACTVSASAITAAGSTFSGIVAAGDQNPRVTTGLDSGGNVNHAAVTAGPASGVPTWTATLSTGTNRLAAGALVRLRELPPIEISGNLQGTATLTATGDVPIYGVDGLFTLRNNAAGSTLRSGALLRGFSAVGDDVDVDGNRGATASITGTAAVTRVASGTLSVTANRTGTAAVNRLASGNLAVTANRTSTAIIAKLFKTLHKALGHAPASIADIVTAFSPNTASGGWHRGDGVMAIWGTGWTAYCFNDFFVSDGAGGVQVFPRRTSVLLVDHDDGQVWWLSGGDGFPLAGSTTFPSTGTGWAWLQGGFATSSDSMVLIGSQWETGSPYTLTGYHVMHVRLVTGTDPPYSVTYPINLDASGAVAWQGHPFVYSGRVLMYGLGTDWAMYLASCPITTTNAADYTSWEYWNGSGWTSTFASRAPITVQNAPLRALSVIPYGGQYLASAKDFDSAPELGIPDAYPLMKVWASASPMGPWKFHGYAKDTSIPDWWTYAAHLDILPGMTLPSVVWSANTTSDLFDPDVYGPHVAAPDQIGVRETTANITGSADVNAVKTIDGNRTATATLTGSATVIHTVAGTLAVTAGSTADGLVAKPVAGTLAATASTTGTAQAEHPTAGNRSATATITGAILVVRTVDGALTASATITGTTTLNRSITGDLTATATRTGDASTEQPLTGSLTVTSTIGGDVLINRGVGGTFTATISASGTAAVERTVSGSLTVTAASTGTLAASRGIAGNTTITATITGELVGVGDVNISGDLSVTAARTGVVLVNHTITGNLAVTNTITSSLQGTRLAAGNFTVTAGRTGSAGGVFVDGSLTTTASFTSTESVDNEIEGDLVVHSQRVGTLAPTLGVQGDLQVTGVRTSLAAISALVSGNLAVTAYISGDIPTELPSVIVVLTTEEITEVGELNVGTNIVVSGPNEVEVTGVRVPITITYTRIRGTTVTPTA